MSERRDKWMYQELTSEGDPCGIPLPYRFLIPADIDEAAEVIAEHLDNCEWSKERTPWDDWEIGQIDGGQRWLKIEESPGVWVKFEVQLEIVRKYSSTKMEECPDASYRKR